MKRTVRSACLALIPATALLAGCNVDSGDKEGNGQYVALGDSYTAAPGVGPGIDPTGCFRSNQNYPSLLAAERSLSLTDVSCGSAQTSNGLEEQKTKVRTVDPQLDALDTDTELVTVSLGANDGGLLPRVVFQCPAYVADGPDIDSDSPCSDKDATFGDESADAVLAQVPDRLVALYEEIKERAPDATVVAVGYPQIFPESGGCDLLPIPEGDIPWAARIVDGLNAAVEFAATEAGIEFLDLQTPTADHHICADDPWIAGSETVPEEAVAFHPYAEEQEFVVELLDELLDGLETSATDAG